MTDATRYTIAVRKVVVDGEDLFEAKVKELPDVATYAATFADAYDVAIDAINSLAEVAAASARAFPEPAKDDEDVSGRFTLRMPKSIHARAIDYARREETSLNTYLISLISHGMGIAEAAQRALSQTNYDRFDLVRQYNAASAMIVLDVQGPPQRDKEQVLISAGSVMATGIAREQIVKELGFTSRGPRPKMVRANG
ncbi:MAG: toxin-antitoxin system HicB family antitoxin [Usitatibacter sp.]